MGVPARAPSPAGAGLVGESQAGAAAVARGGAAGARSVGVSAGGWASRRFRLSGCARSDRTTCGHSTSSSTRPPTGKVLKLLNIVDEFTRESLVMLLERSINADTVVAVLERLVAERGAPGAAPVRQRPGDDAHALRDWCVLSRTGTAFIEPGSPWQNPFVESFHSRVRDELLDVEEFACLAEARVVISDWREDYNWRRPHSALGMKAPAVFAAEWAATSELPTAA